MKMKHTILLNCLGAAFLLLAASACVDEQYTSVPVDGAAGSALAEGTFVVDYVVSDGKDSRAVIGDELAANKRIRSLLYLLYDSENMLVKERVIPNINEQTMWPLLRATMTWEQREALKDTLDANSSYTAVFIANTDKTLFGDTDTQTYEVLAGKENLSTLVLKLPQTPFADNNMYYFWSGAISYEKPDDAISEDSRDNPVSENIVLRRLVSRIDMEQMEITEEVIKEGFGGRFDELLKKELTRNLENLITKLKGNKTDERFRQNCEALEKLLINQIESKDDLKTVLGGTYTDFIDKLLEVCRTADTDELKNPYNARTASWSNFKTAELKFKDMHNTLSLESLTSSYVAPADGESPTLPTSYVYDLNEGKATWIGFADEGTLADGQSPSMILQGITLSGSTTDGTTGDETGTDTGTDGGTDTGEGESGTDNQNTVSLELTFAETPVTISKNGRKTYICNPIGQISPKELGDGETYTGKYEFPVPVKMSEYYGKLEDLLTPENGFAFGGDTSGDDTSTEPQKTKTDFMNAVSEVFGGWGSSTSETGVSFSISIPGVGQFSYQATLEETTPQGDGSSDDAGSTGNDVGAGGDDTSAGEGAVVP